MCVWCRETKQNLKYILPTQHGKKEFCSEICLAEFRRAYNKGACGVCDNVIRGAPIRLEESTQSKEFCSTECLAKFQKQNSPNPPIAISLHNSNLLRTKDAAASKEPEARAKKSATKYPSVSNFTAEGSTGFSWAKYLIEAGGISAPANCFNQVSSSARLRTCSAIY